MQAKIIATASDVFFALVGLGTSLIFASAIVMGSDRGQYVSGIFAGIGFISLIGSVFVGVFLYIMEKQAEKPVQSA